MYFGNKWCVIVICRIEEMTSLSYFFPRTSEMGWKKRHLMEKTRHFHWGWQREVCWSARSTGAKWDMKAQRPVYMIHRGKVTWLPTLGRWAILWFPGGFGFTDRRWPMQFGRKLLIWPGWGLSRRCNVELGRNKDPHPNRKDL